MFMNVASILVYFGNRLYQQLYLIIYQILLHLHDVVQIVLFLVKKFKLSMIFADCNGNKTLQSWFEFFIPMDHNKAASSKKIKKCLGKKHWTITCMRNQDL